MVLGRVWEKERRTGSFLPFYSEVSGFLFLSHYKVILISVLSCVPVEIWK